MQRFIYSGFLFCLIFLLAGRSFAAEGILVLDGQTDEPLPGATAIIDQEAVGISDEKGFIDLSSVSQSATIRITHVGYRNYFVQWPDERGLITVYMEPDYELLDAVTVVGHENQRRLTEIAGSYALVPETEIARFKDESLVRSVNTIPGVRFEERSPVSYRVSIRGNLLRAPFGVRNVKVYWNDIPYTDPTGTTPLNLLDINNIQRVEIIRGPAGSVYGAGMGGVFNIRSTQQSSQPVSGELGTVFGSFGFRKFTGNIHFSGDNHQTSLRYSKQTADGYRDHTYSDREVVQLQSRIFASEKTTLSLNLLYSDLFYETPGGLTLDQYEEDPRQARAISKERNASINQQIFLAGLSHDYKINEQFGNVTSVYMTNGSKENPFITNWELERLKGYGGRTKFYYNFNIGNIPTRASLGGELQYGDFHANSHGNVGGLPDTLRYEDELKILNTFAFGQLEMDLHKDWLLTAGASINYLNYDIHRLQDVALDTSYRVRRVFNPVFSPRIGLVKKISRQIALHGSVSYGFSPPTTEEVRTSDGGINDDLEAEKGINYELGFRGNALKDRLTFDLAVFYMNQKETIVSKTTESGAVTFENSGSTRQYGVELLLSYSIIDDPQSLVSRLRIQTSYTWHHFTFRDYVKNAGGENVDYSGNDLTGTAPNISVSTLDLQTRKGLYTNFTFNFTDRIPLNDGNTVYADNYKLITWKVGCQKQVGDWIDLDFYIGVDNLLNEKYSLGNDLNAFGNRYYNASPERNYFAGLKIKFKEG